jgi:hypothetical protein
MKKTTVRVVLSLSVLIAGVALSRVADAQSGSHGTFPRLRNANTAHGTFYLGVSGGEQCNQYEECGLVAGTQLKVWQKSQLDQTWFLPPQQNGYRFGNVINYFVDLWTGNDLCIVVQNNDAFKQGTNLVVTDCTTDYATKYWYATPAEDLGAPYPGCFAISESLDAMYISVAAGNVQNGSLVDIWPLCRPGSNACGNPSNAFHPDQFWCPEAP